MSDRLAVETVQTWFTDNLANQYTVDGYESLSEFEELEQKGHRMWENFFTWEPDSKLGVVVPAYVEKEFALPIRTSTGRASQYGLFSGKIDGLIKRPDGYWLLENKTTSSWSNKRDKEKYALDHQATGYVYAMSRILGIRIRGVMYQVFVKDYPTKPSLLKSGKLSKAKNQKTTFDLYMQAIRENNLNVADYTEFLKKLQIEPRYGLDRYFIHHEVRRTREQLAEFENQLYQAYQTLREFDRDDRHPLMVADMDCARCWFFDLCQEPDPATRNELKDMLYTQKERSHSELDVVFDDKATVVTASMLRSLSDCEQKYVYSYRDKLYVEKSYLRFGSAWHDTLEQVYKTRIERSKQDGNKEHEGQDPIWYHGNLIREAR